MELYKKPVRQVTKTGVKRTTCHAEPISAIEMYMLTGCYLFLLCYLEQVVQAKSYPRLDRLLGE